MGWWFGRKNALADVRPFVPAWLSTASEGEGFARSYEAQFEEVYRRNPVGQRAVRLVSGLLGALPVYSVSRRRSSIGGLTNSGTPPLPSWKRHSAAGERTSCQPMSRPSRRCASAFPINEA